MINLRYHIVSITAVFLALGIGIAMGSSFLGAAAVDRVDENINDVRNEAATARDERDLAQEEAERLAELEKEMREQGPSTQFTSDLAEVPVVVLTVGGVNDEGLDALRVALESSQAAFDGILRVDDKVSDSGSAAELAEVLDAQGATGEELRGDLVAAVASELVEHGVRAGDPSSDPSSTVPGTTAPGTTVPGTAPGDTTEPPVPPTGPETTVPPEGTPTTVPGEGDAPAIPEPTTIQDLVAGGFLAWEPAPGGPDTAALLSGGGYRYVFVDGVGAEVPDVLLPIAGAMAEDGPAPVVVAAAALGEDSEEREANRSRLLAPIRSDDLLRDRVSTVDDLEVFPGTAAVIGAVSDLAETERGHYGLGEDRDSLLPPP